MSLPATQIEALYVVDTNALIRYLMHDKKLGKQAGEIFGAAERGETRLILSAISLAELYYANRKHRWFHDFAEVYQKLKVSPFFRFVPFKPDQILDFDRDASVPEMHDRIIAGLPRRVGAPLIASDPLIVQPNIVQTVW
jgi:predicted nucleic acid-binding protein